MTRKEELFDKLKKAPADRGALENAVAYFAHRGEFLDLYQGLEEIVASIEGRDDAAELRSRMVDVVRKHLDSAADPALAANLKLRLARLLLSDRNTDPKEGLVLLTDAFELIPSPEVGQQILDMLRQMKLSMFVVQMLRSKAAAETDPEKRMDTLLQLGHAALSAGRVHEARKVFEDLSAAPEPWSEKGKQNTAVVAAAEEELEKSIAQAQGALTGANDLEKPIHKLKLARLYVSAGRFDDGTRLLEDLAAVPKADEALMELISVYRETDSYDRLLALVEERAEKDVPDEVRKELLKERVRLYLDKLADPKRGRVALDDLYARFPGVPDVVDFCAQTLSDLGDTAALADLLAKARSDTKNRDQERRFLEWEAGLRWKALGALDEAEKLYRRIKSIDPRNEPALVFYEEYALQKGDLRKLYSVLSTRASLVPDAQKVDILKRMAALSVESLEAPDRAIESLKKVLVLSPDDVQAFADLARLLEDQRRWHAAVDLYSARADRLPADAVTEKLDLLSRMLEIYSSKEKLPVPEMVVTIYRRMLIAAPDHAPALDALADFHRANRRYPELVEVLEKKAQVEADPDSQLALHRELAEILVTQLHQESAAIPHLESVVSLVPTDTAALGLLAKAYKAGSDHERFFDAGRRLLPSLRGAERNEMLEELATVAMERLHRDEDAVELLEKLFSLDPRHPWAQRKLRHMYTKLERWDDLVRLLEKGIETSSTDAQRREHKEKLAQVLHEKLGQNDRARQLLQELVAESPGNRAARQTLQRMLVASSDFRELQAIHARENNLPGLLRFLDETRTKENDPERIRTIGMETVRIAGEVMRDRGRAVQVLEGLLDQLPGDAEVARSLLSFYPEGKEDMEVARALAVIADNEQGAEATDAALRLADLLEKIGEFEASYTRTLGLFLTAVREGDAGLFPALGDRAEKAESLEALSSVVEDLLNEELSVPTLREVSIRLSGIYTVRLKDTARAVAVLKKQHEREPDSIEVLRELEKVYTASSSWEALEVVIRKLADLMSDADARREELHKLARLYEEILTDMDKAVEVYRELRGLDPGDQEAVDGLQRGLEELERWADLASVLEEDLSSAAPGARRDLLERIAILHDQKLGNAAKAAAVWQEVLSSWPDDETAWAAVEKLFERGEALDVVILLLEGRYEAAQEWAKLVEVLARRSDASEDDSERYETLNRTAEILRERLGQSAESFACLRAMAVINPSGPGLIQRLGGVGREAGLEGDLADVLRGMLRIGESSFAARTEVEGRDEFDAAVMLSDLARKLGNAGIAIDALVRARESMPGDLALVGQLEELYEQESRYEDLLALLVEKKDLIWEEPEKRSLQMRMADLLTDKLGREEESIPWIEAVHAMDESVASLDRTEGTVADRLESLYRKYERWGDLASLLRDRIARLDGAERRLAAYHLAIVRRDHLKDISSAYEVLADIVAQESDNETYVSALSHILKMTDAEGYESVASKAVAVLEPIVTQHQDWVRLSDVLEAKATLSVDARQAARAWHALALVQRDKLAKGDRAFQSLCKAAEQLPGSPGLLDDMMALGFKGAKLGRALDAIEKGLGGIEDASDAGPLKVLADALRDKAKDLPRAARAYLRLTQIESDTIEHYEALDAIYKESGDVDGRIRVLSDVVDRVSGAQRAEKLLTLAELQWDGSMRSEAVETLTRALASPELLSEERRDFAFQRLSQALEASQDWFDLTQVLASQIRFTTEPAAKVLLLMRTGAIEEEKLSNQDRAIAAYRAILEIEPRHPAASERLFHLLATTGRNKDLEELLTIQADLATTDHDKMSLLVRLAKVRLFDLAEPEPAVDALSVLVETDIFDDEVVALLEKVVEDHSGHAFKATQLLEHAYDSKKKYDRLAEIYKIQIDRYPDEIDTVQRYRDLAAVYEKHFSDLDAAFLYISQAFKLEPSSQAVHDLLVQYARARGSFDELFGIYIDVLAGLDERDDRIALRRRMAELYHDELQDLDHAETIYKDTLDDDPGNTFALDQLQSLYKETSSWPKLVEVLRTKVLQAANDQARVALLYEIAGVYRDGSQSQSEALDTYEEILSVAPRQWDAYRGIETIHREREDVQGVVTCLRRELDLRQEKADRIEVRLRLAATLFAELSDNDSAVVELAQVLADEPAEQGAIDLLEEILDKWDEPSDKCIDLLVAAYTTAARWEQLVALYQKLAGRSKDAAGRGEWLRKIYDVRTVRQNDHRGAYAACKIMLTLDPADAARRELLVQHALAVGELDDLRSFLEAMLSDEPVKGSDAEPDFHFLLAALSEEHLRDSATAAVHYEAAAATERPDLAPKARERLRALYPGLHSWAKYVELLEVSAGETTAADERKAMLLEAATVARDTLKNKERALTLLAAAASEFADDREVLDQYEAILVQLKKTEELETVLRQRVGLERDSDERAKVRLRLGNLLLATSERISEGVDELLSSLSESGKLPAVWAILESLMSSESTADQDRVRISVALLDAYPADVEPARKVLALETHLGLETDEQELNRLHLALARLAEAMDDPEKAFIHYSQSLRLVPGVDEVELRIAALAEKRGLHADRRDLLVELAAGADAEDIKIRYLLTAAAIDMEKLSLPQSAAALWEQVLGIDSANVSALKELEAYYRTTGDFALLSGVLEKEIEIETNAGQRQALSIDLARICTNELQDLDRARRWWEEVQHEPEARAEAVRNLESIYGSQEDWERLCDLLLVLREEAENDDVRMGVLARLAAVYEQKLDNVEEAFQRYKGLLALDPMSGAGLNGAKRCALRLEDWSTLSDVSEKLLESAAGADARALHEELVHTYIERLGSKERGLHHFQALLEEGTLSEPMCDLGLSQLQDPEIGLPLAISIEPVLEAAADWTRLVEVFRAQFQLLTDQKERSAAAIKAAEVYCEKLGSLSDGFDALWWVLESSPADDAVLAKLEELAKKRSAWRAYVDLIEKAYGNASTSSALFRLASLAALAYANRLRLAPAALEWYRKALSEDPTDATTISAVEELLTNEKMLDELARFYDEASQSFDGKERVPLLLKLGFLRESELADSAAAIHAYRDVLAVDQENAAATARLDAMLDHPILGLAAVEILEPVYRVRKDDERLARVLTVKAAEVEGSLDRSNLLAEAAKLTAGIAGRETDALETCIQAIRQKVFDPNDVLPLASGLADKLGRWQDFVSALEAVCAETDSQDLKLDLSRRLALIYLEKLPNPALAEVKLRDILQVDPSNWFALNLMVKILEAQGDARQQIAALEKLADSSADAHQKKAHYEKAGDLALSIDDQERAVHLLQKAMRAAPQDAGVMERLAAVYRQNERWKDLVDLLEARGGLPDEPAAVEALIEAAYLASERLRSPERAGELCRVALDRDPKNADTLRLLIGILRDGGRTADHVDALEKFAAVAEGEELLGTLWKLYDLALESGDKEAAVGYIERVLSADPKNTQAVEAKIELLKGGANLYGLVSTYEDQAKAAENVDEKSNLLYEAAATLADEIGDRAGALRKLHEILDLLPWNVRALRKVAQLLLQAGDFSEAVKTYEKISDIVPGASDKIEALNAAARLSLKELSDPELATLYAGKVIELDASDADAFEIKSSALEARGEHAALAELFLQQVGRTADKTKKGALCKRLAALYRDVLQKPDEYVRWAQEALAAQDEPTLTEELVVFHRKAGDTERLAEMLDRKVTQLLKRRQAKDVPSLLFELGLARMRLGQKDAALDALKRCVEMDGANLPAVYALASLMSEMGNADAAVSHYQTLLLRINELESKDQKVSVYLALARIHSARGDAKKAKTYLTRLLSIDRKHSEALDLLGKVS